MRTLAAITVNLLFGSYSYGQSAVVDRYLNDPLTYTDIVTSSDQVDQPRDLDFKPNTNELWVMNKGGSNGGSMVIVHNAGLPGQTSEYRKDTHSGHFMVQASAMAFSPNGEWAAVNEVQNTSSASSTFMGPALWSGDLNIFAEVFQNNWVSGRPLGSHLDMLHQSPYAMGIASDSAKVYWVMDGHFETICRYDFVMDHGPGYDDHSTGKIWRYTDVPVTREPNIPSHMVLDRENGWLYFIDGGAKQIKRMDVNSGAVAGNLNVPSTSPEQLAGYFDVQGATVEVIDTWTTQPSGIDHVEGRLIVSDHTNGDIQIYDVTGEPAWMGTIATGMSSIMGVKIGPDGRIWFTHYNGNKVVRIDPAPLENDAAITTIITPNTIATTPNFFSVDHDVCASSIAPVVTLANWGSNELVSVEIHSNIDGTDAAMFEWTGTLAPGATIDVTLPSMPVTSGARLLKVWTEQPNGTSDAIPMNDAMAGSFRVVAPVMELPFFEGFDDAEFPPADWNYVYFNPNNMMSRHATAGGFGNSNGSVKMDHYSGPMNITGQLDHLMMPRVDLSTVPVGTLLEFSLAYRQYNTSTSDRLMVRASTDCGENWITLYDKAGTELATTSAGTSAFTPDATQWRTEMVVLDQVIGQPEVILMFVTESGYGNNMYLDDIQLGTIVGIGERQALQFNMFPNPAGEFVDLVFGEMGDVTSIELYDALGKVVRNIPVTDPMNSTHRLDLGGVANGSYTVLVRSATTVGSRSLMVTGR